MPNLFHPAYLDVVKEMNGETKERNFLKRLGKDYLDAERDTPLVVELLSELDPSDSATRPS